MRLKKNKKGENINEDVFCLLKKKKKIIIGGVECSNQWRCKKLQRITTEYAEVKTVKFSVDARRSLNSIW